MAKRRYFEPTTIESDDADPLVEPDRTSWFCLGRVLLAVLFVGLCAVVIAALGLYHYLTALPAE